jgi:microsomal dipeptidase-like Zn-dependent dipeptidase
MSFNIDIHCHPSTKPFMSSMIDAEKKSVFEKYNHNIESSVMELLKKQFEKLSEVHLATQSNFDSLFRGGHRVVVASITPMERGFLVAGDMKNIKPKALSLIAKAFVFDLGYWPGTIKPILINGLMGFSTKNIEFVRNASGLTNYFKDGLLPEYNYLKGFHNKVSPQEKYTLKLVNSFKEIEDGMLTDGGKALYVILSVEGAHALKNMVPVTTEIKANQGRVYTPEELNEVEDGPGIKANITAMKKWKHVPLFITVMHHFWNGMGGHARSLNKLVGEVLNQSEGINQPLTALGRPFIRDLLSTTNGPRILVDIKHMSVASRREFYNMLDTEMQFQGQNIPIICSHTGVASDIDSLNELEQVNDKAEEENSSSYFHKARINLCGEDVRRIAKGGGLIGIQLDEKRIAGAGFVRKNFRGGLTDNELRNVCAELIMSNVFMMVRAVNAINAWNLFCIGSDYDGLINHLDPFPTSASANILREEIEFYLNNLHEVREPNTGKLIFSATAMKKLMMGLSAKQITEKIFSSNVMAFLKKNFNRV